MKGRFRDTTRERLGSEENEIEGMLADDVRSAREIEDSELIDDLLTGASFSVLELDIFTQLVQGKIKERVLVKELAEKHGLPIKTVKDSVKDVKDYLVLKLKK